MSSFGLLMKDDQYDIPSLYWIPTLHKGPHKQRHIVAATKCSSKPHFALLYSYRCLICVSRGTMTSALLEAELINYGYLKKVKKNC